VAEQDTDQQREFSIRRVCQFAGTYLVHSNIEIEFLNEQIVRCEKARADYSKSNQAYHRRADALLLAYEEQLTRLQDAPFLLQMVLASDEPINPALAESIGVEITEYQSPAANCFIAVAMMLFLQKAWMIRVRHWPR